jgi:hypothetical protein
MVEVADIADLYGVDFRLTYDPNLVEVIDANPNEPGIQVALGSVFDGAQPLVVTNEAGNGVIHLVATLQAPSPAFSGTGSLINITWQGNNPGETPLIFEEVKLADPQGQPLSVTSQNGQLQVGSGILLRGQVQLQARLDYSGVTVATAGQAVQTDTEGRFELESAEAYQLTVTAPGFLSARAEGTVPVGSDTFDLGTVVLPGGEVTGDDRIDILDLVIIASHFGSNDKNIDINGNGLVDIYDLTVAAVNYGKNGPVTDWQ